MKHLKNKFDRNCKLAESELDIVKGGGANGGGSGHTGPLGGGITRDHGEAAAKTPAPMKRREG